MTRNDRDSCWRTFWEKKRGTTVHPKRTVREGAAKTKALLQDQRAQVWRKQGELCQAHYDVEILQVKAEKLEQRKKKLKEDTQSDGLRQKRPHQSVLAAAEAATTSDSLTDIPPSLWKLQLCLGVVQAYHTCRTITGTDAREVQLVAPRSSGSSQWRWTGNERLLAVAEAIALFQWLSECSVVKIRAE